MNHFSILAGLVVWLTTHALQAQEIVEVSTVHDLFRNIRPNTTVILAPGDYHLEQVDSSLENVHCNWAMVLFDEIMKNETNDEDKTLLVTNLENFTIKTKGNKQARILTNRRAASVMAFRNCDNIRLEGVVFGHDIVKDPGDLYISFCSGEVLEFFDCNTIVLKNDELFGCGTRGFLAHRCKDLKIENTVIKECSYGAFGVFQCENISFKKCVFKDNAYRWLMEIVDSKNMRVKKSVILDSGISEYNEGVVNLSGSENIQLNKFKLKNNDFEELMKNIK